MLSKIMCLFGHRFGRVLESVLGEFWDAKILDFRSFFDVFSKHFSNIILEGQKIEKKRPNIQNDTNFRSNLRNARPAGERKREGSKKPQD